MSAESNALMRKLRAYHVLGVADVAALEDLQGESMHFSAGEDIILQGQKRHGAFVVRRGWALSIKNLPDGRRPVVDVHLPGDFLAWRSLWLSSADRTFQALTKVEVAPLKTERLLETLYMAPGLARALLWVGAREEAMVVERLVSIAARDATARTAHFLLELDARTKLIGQHSGDGFLCPLSQTVLADTLGMTPIHLNRVLRQLRESNLLVFRDGVVTFPDRERLAERTGFNRDYLDEFSLTPS
jgi:CRP-like cAMP-binding protein